MVAILGICALALYLVTLQAGLYNDGIFFVERLEAGEFVFNHLLYLPLAHLLHGLVAVVVPSMSMEASLKLLSAICAAGSVVLTFSVAVLVLNRIGVAGIGVAAIAAATLALLPGCWFFATASELHAVNLLCATLLFLGLLHAVHEGRPWRLRHGTLQFLGAVLTPASHASGVCAVLPAAYAVSRSSARQWVLVCLGLGFGAFAVTYLALLLSSRSLEHYHQVFSATHMVVFNDPGRVPGLLMTSLSELLLPAAPASTLVPVGLRLLFPAAPAWGWLCLLWLGAWPLMAFPIGEQAYGSYYLPTYPVQALLAVVAMRRLSRDLRSAVVITAVAVLPGVAALLGQGWGLLAWWVCAAWLFFGPGVRAAATERPAVAVGLSLGLPLATLLLSGIGHVPAFGEDPVRELIRALDRTAAVDAR
ncbi:MAG: hypothetical protein V3U11_11260, partial [Planctomycetota bacterium]